MKKMMSTLLGATMAIAGMGTAFSHNSINVDSCEFNIPYDIELEKNVVVISSHHGEILKIDEINQLFIEGNPQVLNKTQQQIVVQLGDGYRNLVPTIARIAGESAEIGLKAATLTLNTLFADDPAETERLMAKLDGIGEKIEQKANTNEFSGNLASADVLGQQLDEEMEGLIEEAVENASGRVFWNMLTQIFSGDEEEQKDLEFRMEMFAEDVETQIEEQAKQLEFYADKLCDNIKHLDQSETKLQKSLSEFSEIDVIQHN